MRGKGPGVSPVLWASLILSSVARRIGMATARRASPLLHEDIGAIGLPAEVVIEDLSRSGRSVPARRQLPELPEYVGVMPGGAIASHG